jgi:hypothetical protein
VMDHRDPEESGPLKFKAANSFVIFAISV